MAPKLVKLVNLGPDLDLKIATMTNKSVTIATKAVMIAATRVVTEETATREMIVTDAAMIVMIVTDVIVTEETRDVAMIVIDVTIATDDMMTVTDEMIVTGAMTANRKKTSASQHHQPRQLRTEPLLVRGSHMHRCFG